MKKIYSVLILAVAMAACTRSEQPQIPDEPDAPRAYKMTIEASKAPITRGLQYNEENYTLSALWKKGENVAVLTPDLTSSAYHFKQIGELIAQGVGPSTILSGEVYGEPAMDMLLFMYPRYPMDYTGQKGTLDDIAQRYDYSAQAGNYSSFTVNGGEITGSISQSFINYQAIIRFQLENGNGDPIIADQLIIHDSGNPSRLVKVTYMSSDDDTGDITISLDDPSSEIWAAICIPNNNTTFDLTLTATAEDHTYICNVGSVTLYQNYFYPVKAVMKEAYTVTVDPNIQHGSITVSPASTIEAGTQMTLNISPWTNYALSSLILHYEGEDHDVTAEVNNNSYSFYMPADNVTVSATFEEIPSYQVSVMVIGADGCYVYLPPYNFIYPDWTGDFPWYKEGDSVFLGLNPVDNYVLESLYDGDQDITDQVFYSFQNKNLRYEFTMPAADKHFTATFTEANGVTLGRSDYGSGETGPTWE